jgi:CrcB protein
MTLLLVMVGGGLGSGARYLIGRWAIDAFGPQFPYGTVLINLVGCFALGVVAQLSSAGAMTLETRTVLAAGLLGGFTTYSSFNQETLALLGSGAFASAAMNVVATLAGGLAAGLLGMLAGRFLMPNA